MNNDEKYTEEMKRIWLWHRFSQLIVACLYITAIPFLVIFILHATKPDFVWCHTCMRAFMFSAIAFFICKIVTALVIKYKVNKWEHNTHNKLTNKQLIHLM